ncbi:hypothetical protein, variant [Phialophora macrospora]|uniref:C2H2-type domain-containing protein n=1 Tax=Phialophora macrospora TaxID=1851006 RepID=A0A0D2FX57_9EURO|nr:hypothetical protein PV04_09428 [Phialophora macrospora]KIW64500.1 hypothetical protein, variant [Phialophora macrospora]
MYAQSQPSNSVSSQQDIVWRGLVFQFISFHAPATVNGDLRDTLGDLVQGFFNTSQDTTMQNLVVALDQRYNLTGLVDASLLATVRNNVANQANAMLQQQLPLSRPPQPAQPAAPSYSFSIPPTMPPMPPQSSLPPPPPMPPPQPPMFPTPQPALRRCFPPNLNCHVAIKWRQQDWAYVCDLCGHTHPDRGDFNRHMKIGAQRVGFKIVSADPENDRHWYAVDGAGNQYMGDIVPRTRNKEKGGKRVQVPHPPPCGPRIVEFERPRRRQARIAAKAAKERAAKLREQDKEKDGGDQEGEER